MRNGYELRGEARPEETTDTWMRFRVGVEAKKTASLVVEEARPVSTAFSLANVTDNVVASFVAQRSIDQSVENALRRILAQKAKIAEIENQSEAREDERDKIFDDQQRLRENMKALKGSPEEKVLVQRYTQQLNEQENRLETLRRESEALDAKKDSEQAVLEKMIAAVTADVKM